MAEAVREMVTDKVNLLGLITRAARGEVALPQFQRNFVWDRDAIADLIVSLLRGYYIGSFLLLRCDVEEPPFSVRPIQGSKLSPDDLRPELLILDGQQRLTSLHYAFEAPDEPMRYTKYPYRFFIQLDRLLDGIEEELVVSYRADQIGTWEDRTEQFKQRVVPLTAVREWHRWLDDYTDWLEDTGQSDVKATYRDQWRGAWRKAVGDNLLEAQIPYVEMPRIHQDDQEGLAEVCVVFEKLNSTGEPLSVFDLLTARLFRFGIDLHRLWEEAVDVNPRLQEFSSSQTDRYGVFVLRTLALQRGLEVRSKSLINLSPEDFENDWERAVTAVERALERLVSTKEGGFGVLSAKWQPYTTLLPVLAATLWRLEETRVGHHGWEDLQAWYWGSVFTERYTGAVETVTYRDTMDLYRRFEDPTHDTAVFAEVRERILDNPGFSFRSLGRVSSPYKALMNLTVIRGARDFRTGDPVELHELEDHHVFPRAFLRDSRELKGGVEVNTIVNRTLLTAATNRMISRKSPAEYLDQIIPEEKASEILESHFIDSQAQRAMGEDDYERYLELRDRALVGQVRSLLQRAKGTPG